MAARDDQCSRRLNFYFISIKPLDILDDTSGPFPGVLGPTIPEFFYWVKTVCFQRDKDN